MSPWTAEGNFNVDLRKSEIVDDINTNTMETSRLENRLSSGGHLTQYIGKSQTVFVGGALNDLNSIRVDPEGKRKLVGNFSSESGNGVFPLHRPTPHVEQVATNNLAGGDYFMQCANKFELLTGANGISMKTLGPLNIQGRIMSISGDQVNISSDKEVMIDGGDNTTITGNSLTLCPRMQEVDGQQFKSIALDATVGTTGNFINKGGMHVEGQLFTQGITAPVEYQNSEPTLNFGSMMAGVEIGRVVGNRVISVAARNATVSPTTVRYATPPMTLVDTNDEVRMAASALNGAEPILAQPISHLETRTKEYDPIQFFNSPLFNLLNDCDDTELNRNIDRFQAGEITQEEFIATLTNASDSPISETQRSGRDCGMCD